MEKPILSGKGMFVWQVKELDRGDVKLAASEAAEAGFSHVLVKVLDGAQPYNQKPIYDISGRFLRWEDVLLEPFVEAFQKEGIEVWGWQWLNFWNAKAEAQAAKARVKQLNLKGFVINGEGPVKNKPTQTVDYIRELNGIGVPTAFSSYRRPDLHPEVYWSAWIGTVDIMMPQVYWLHARNSGAQLLRSMAEYEKLYQRLKISYRRVYIPTGAAFSEWGWAAKPGEVQEFMQVAKDQGLPAVNFWRWAHSRQLKIWETISAFDYPRWEEPEPTPEPGPASRIRLKGRVILSEGGELEVAQELPGHYRAYVNINKTDAEPV